MRSTTLVVTGDSTAGAKEAARPLSASGTFRQHDLPGYNAPPQAEQVQVVMDPVFVKGIEPIGILEYTCSVHMKVFNKPQGHAHPADFHISLWLVEYGPATLLSQLISVCPERGFLFEIKACEKFYRRHIVDIPRIKF